MTSLENIDCLVWREKLMVNGLNSIAAHFNFTPNDAIAFLHTFIAADNLDQARSDDPQEQSAAAKDKQIPEFPKSAYDALSQLDEPVLAEIRENIRSIFLPHNAVHLPIEILQHILEIATLTQLPIKMSTAEKQEIKRDLHFYPYWFLLDGNDDSNIGFTTSAYSICVNLKSILQNPEMRDQLQRCIAEKKVQLLNKIRQSTFPDAPAKYRSN